MRWTQPGERPTLAPREALGGGDDEMKTTTGARFDLDRFIAECRGALAESAPQQSVHELLARAVSEPGAVTRVVGEPKGAGLQALHRSAELTILNSVWPP